MNNMKSGQLWIVNCRSPNNTGRFVVLQEYKGLVDCGESIGEQHVWRVHPISNQRLFTRKSDQGKISKDYFLPASWMVPVTIEDSELDMFLLLWAEDERTMRLE